jgi:hypothetical protein
VKSFLVVIMARRRSRGKVHRRLFLMRVLEMEAEEEMISEKTVVAAGAALPNLVTYCFLQMLGNML